MPSGYIKRRIPLTSKPDYPVGIDWSNKFASKGMGLWLPPDVRNLQNNTRSSKGSGATVVATYKGIALNYDATSSATLDHPLSDAPKIGGFDKLTISLGFIAGFDSTFAPGSLIVLLDTTADNAEGVRLLWTTAKQWRFRLFTGGVTNLDVTPPSFSAGDYIQLNFVYDGSDMRIYHGSNELTSTAKTGNVTEAGDDWGIGCLVSSTNSTSIQSDLLYFHVSPNVAFTGRDVKDFNNNPYQLLQPRTQVIPFSTGVASTTGALTGTALDSIVESDIVDGGKTIIITLTSDTWVATGATFNAQRQNIINGLDSAQAEGTGWDAEVKANLAVTTVVRTSDTVVTVTLSAQSAYDITVQETITATIPATALVTSGDAVVASPTLTVDSAASGRIMGSLAGRGGLAGIRRGLAG